MYVHPTLPQPVYLFAVLSRFFCLPRCQLSAALTGDRS